MTISPFFLKTNSIVILIQSARKHFSVPEHTSSTTHCWHQCCPHFKGGKSWAQQLTHVCSKNWSSTQDSRPWIQYLNSEDHSQGHRIKAYLWLAVWGKVWTHTPVTLGSQRRWLSIPIGISVSWWPPIICEGKENSDHRGFPPDTGWAKEGDSFLLFVVCLVLVFFPLPRQQEIFPRKQQKEQHKQPMSVPVSGFSGSRPKCFTERRDGRGQGRG